MSLDETADKVSLLMKIVIVSFVVVMILSYLTAMILGPLIFFFTESGSEVASRSVRLDFYLAGFPYPISMEANTGLFFLFLWLVYCGAFFASYVSGEKFHRLLRKPGGYTYSDFTRNFLFSMPIITTLLYTALVALVILQVVFGISSGPSIVSKEPSQLIMFFYLTYSPVAEELGFRLIPIGLLTTISLSIIARKNVRSRIEFLKIAFLGFLFPDKAKEIAGVKSIHRFGPLKGIAIYEWIFILLTSAFFGFAHYQFGGWNIGKITTSSIFGAALALAYLIYGIHAPILMHWWFNYYYEAYFQAWHVNSSISWMLIIILLWMITLIGGAIGWFFISTRIGKSVERPLQF